MNMALFSSAAADPGSDTRDLGTWPNDMGDGHARGWGWCRGICSGRSPFVWFHNDGPQNRINLYAAVSDVRDERVIVFCLTFSRACWASYRSRWRKHKVFLFFLPSHGLRSSYNRAVGSSKEALLDRLTNYSRWANRIGGSKCATSFVSFPRGAKIFCPHDLFSSREKGDFIESNGSLWCLKDTKDGELIFSMGKKIRTFLIPWILVVVASIKTNALSFCAQSL